jgi:RNA polymerase sigma factor (sigma-70 family)
LAGPARRAPLFSKHQLILDNRISARKVARNILKKWNAKLPGEEIDSAVDLALCEAAHRYRPSPNASFITYLFYFLKGCLVKAISANNTAFNQVVHEHIKHEALDAGPANIEVEPAQEAVKKELLQEEESITSISPEDQVFHRELKGRCREALLHLSNLERELLLNIHVLELKTTTVAKQLGYSRGHLFNVRRAAIEKVRNELWDLKEAA